METLRKFIWGKDDTEEAQDATLQLPRPVERAYVLSKDAGHRGPVIGGYMILGFEDIQIACTVTPSVVTVVAANTGIILSTYLPEQGDAFTACCLIPLEEAAKGTRFCGIVLGTQKGNVLVRELASKVRQIARCEASNTSITVMALVNTSTVIVGNISGQLRVYDPIRHPETPSVSLSVSATPLAITAIAPVSDNTLWVAIDTCGIVAVSMQVDQALGVVSMQLSANEARTIRFDGMQSITSISNSTSQGLAICLSSCSDVFLISKESGELVQRYPASLMTCGSPLAVMTTVDSTYLFLGGMDGSLSIRELNRRDRDGRLQCVLHRCIDRLTPQTKGEGSDSPSDGCPISSLWVSENLEQCVVGDASCTLFVVPLTLVKPSRAYSATIDDQCVPLEEFSEPITAGHESPILIMREEKVDSDARSAGTEPLTDGPDEAAAVNTVETEEKSHETDGTKLTDARAVLNSTEVLNVEVESVETNGSKLIDARAVVNSTEILNVEVESAKIDGSKLPDQSAAIEVESSETDRLDLPDDGGAVNSAEVLNVEVESAEADVNGNPSTTGQGQKKTNKPRRPKNRQKKP